MFSISKLTLLASLAAVTGLASAAPSPGNHFGKTTLYFPAVGACGVSNTNDDMVAAVSPAIFDQFGTGNPNNNPVCGRFIVVTTSDGKSVRAQVEDKCSGCAEGDILLSPGAFSKLADPSVAVIQNTNWKFFTK